MSSGSVVHAVSPLERDAMEGGCVREQVDADVERMGHQEVVKSRDPKKPSDEGVREQMMTHLPYRDWCRHCVRCRGKELPHKKNNDETELPEVHMDSMFMGEEDKPGETVAVLVVREKTTKMGMANVAPSKSTGEFVAKRVMALLKEVGCEMGTLS